MRETLKAILKIIKSLLINYLMVIVLFDLAELLMKWITDLTRLEAVVFLCIMIWGMRDDYRNEAK